MGAGAGRQSWPEQLGGAWKGRRSDGVGICCRGGASSAVGVHRGRNGSRQPPRILAGIPGSGGGSRGGWWQRQPPRKLSRVVSWELPISSPGQAAAQRGDGWATQPRWLPRVPKSGVQAAGSPGAQPQPWAPSTQPEGTGGEEVGRRGLGAGGSSGCSSGLPKKHQLTPGRCSRHEAPASGRDEPGGGGPPQLPPQRARPSAAPPCTAPHQRWGAATSGHRGTAAGPAATSSWGRSSPKSTNTKRGPASHPPRPRLPGRSRGSAPGGSGPLTRAGR